MLINLTPPIHSRAIVLVFRQLEAEDVLDSELSSFFFPMGPLWYWWAFLPAVVINAIFLRYGLKINRVDWRQALKASFSINVVSGMIAGAVPTIFAPIFLLLAFVVPGLVMILPFLIFPLVDSMVEFLCLWLFRELLKFPVSPEVAVQLLLSNFLTIVLLFLILSIFPGLQHEWLTWSQS